VIPGKWHSLRIHASEGQKVERENQQRDNLIERCTARRAIWILALEGLGEYTFIQVGRI
jgi:hypothetical protein